MTEARRGRRRKRGEGVMSVAAWFEMEWVPQTMGLDALLERCPLVCLHREEAQSEETIHWVGMK
jgi:hypothetical protein